MASEQGDPAWPNYRRAIEELYGSSVEQIATNPELRLIDPSNDQVELALTASEVLTESLRGDVEVGGQRNEVAVIRLLAAATIDLGILYDLVAFDPELPNLPERPRAGWGRSVLADSLGEALPVLDAHPSEVFQRLIIAGGSALTVIEARERLCESMGAATQGTLSDTSSAAIAAVSILLGSAIGYVQEAVTVPLHDIFGRLMRHTRWVGRALRNAVEKVAATLDGALEGARTATREWIEDRAERLGSNALERWLGGMYGADAMVAELTAAIMSKGKDANALMRGASGVELLAARFHAQMKFARRVAWLVSHTRAFLFGISPPVGMIAVLAGSVVATGGAVFLGADYLDAGKSKIASLGLVTGIEPIARGAL
jgi:hypothetical protein